MSYVRAYVLQQHGRPARIVFTDEENRILGTPKGEAVKRLEMPWQFEKMSQGPNTTPHALYAIGTEVIERSSNDAFMDDGQGTPITHAFTLPHEAYQRILERQANCARELHRSYQEIDATVQEHTKQLHAWAATEKERVSKEQPRLEHLLKAELDRLNTE
ncbi:hypothetical protein C4580_03255 [Candidatus Woesearchaeota archaeon]|nr:MAG: hypothetical protein C4580_03255 [Candidatus Woesearchaeota archaeon]